MNKKILIFILFIFLSACTVQDKKESRNYIEPVHDVFLFDELKEETKNKFINEGINSLENYELEAINTKSYEKDIVDIYGNIINLSDLKDYILEIVSVSCSHCKKQIIDTYSEINNLDYPLIQFFGDGDKESIESFYEEISLKMPENIIFVGRDEDLLNYLIDEVKIVYYPSTMSFKDNYLKICLGTERSSLKGLINLSFIDEIKYEDLTDKDNNSIFSKKRTLDDVFSSLSEENQQRLLAIDNDSFTKELTLRLISTKLDNSISEVNNNIFLNEVNNYDKYLNSKWIVFYETLKDENDTDKIEFLNSLMIDENYEYLVVFIEGINSSTNAYLKMDTKLKCLAVSNASTILKGLEDIPLIAYPTAVFIDEGTFTGAYSNIEDYETFKKAIDLFLSENSIAYLENN